MNHNRNTISRKPNVKLNPIRSNCDRFAKRREGILGRDSRRTAMTDYQRCIH
jgi:hypothetical protein